MAILQMALHYGPAINAVLAAGLLWRKRTEMVATVRRMPWYLKLAVGVLLAVGALIPGPVDDILIAALVLRMAR